ncbi:S8 family serine peptidase (plasmid) [Streptomyces sp. NBC_01450]|uniref:S8 family serine peptidase n=1 Tax=Streptomyces sp. NBC_01450 TaxID=2903871 RepID=UPI002E34727D|nr:S8 family serine peptidase [Streptomyces sp. NBC_01450]
MTSAPADAASAAKPTAADVLPAPTDAPTGGPHTVTLITGDKVTVTHTGDGQVAATVRGPGGGPVAAHVMTVGKDTYAYPDSALPFLASGVLDERLFDVTELLADGYDDVHSDHLPLIVTYTDTAVRSRKTAVPAGAHQTLALSSIRGAALSQSHARAADFWASVTGGGSESARTARTAPALADGIAKVWLDGKAKAALSDTTAQIGAPQVWQGGDTGQGVDVAVLDTGIDAAHPDFTDRIAATASFVPGEDVTDRHGHGTHVASTIAGTGAASGGKEKGVAPGASLHIGKVLDNDGSGQDSWIVAGMEWAARDQHAKIVSMSLGADPTDGPDPLSQAVDSLSAETGALFVVAAGNSGPAPYSLDSPGTADAALTVGAVDSSDRLASFSSRGPRLGDNALKPELTAPGVDVLAARSQYSPEGTGSYLTMSGTSMATPHVAGAAVLLAHAHPGWSGQQLKDALVSTTKTTAQYSPYAGGSGRLDVAAAVNGTVFATGTAFASVHWPYPAGQTVRKDVTYTNTGSQPVTLDLALNTPGVPAGLFTLTTSQVTVPARGTSTVGVMSHLDAAADDAGYSAVLTATGPDGVLRTHTPVGVTKQSRRVELTIKAKDRQGGGLSGTLVLKDSAHNTMPKIYEIDGSGNLDLSLPASTYSAWMYADVPGIEASHSLGRAVLSAPQVDLDTDRTVVFDAADLRKVSARTPQRTTNSSMQVDQYRSYGKLVPFTDSYQLEARYDSLWATPSPKVTQGSYTFTTRWRQVQPPLTLDFAGTSYGDAQIQSYSPPLPQGTAVYGAVYAGDGAATDFARLHLRNRIAVVRRNDTVAATDQAAAAAKAGARLLLIVNDGYGRLDAWADLPPEDAAALPVASLDADQGALLIRRIQRGTAALRTVSHPYPQYLYDLVQHHHGAVPAALTYRPGPGDLARIDEDVRDTRAGQALDIRYDVSVDTGRPMSVAVTPVDAQGKYTAWVTAEPGVRWVSEESVPDLTEIGASVSYRPGSTTEETWFAPVQHPRLLSDSALVTAPSRVGDILAVYDMPAWGDARGHTGASYDVDAAVDISLYQGDKLLGQGNSIGASGVTPDPLPYRLVVDGTRKIPGRPYSPRTHTEWGFTSAFTDYTTQLPLPLIQLDYGVPTDLSGRAHRHTELSVTPSQLARATGAGTIGTVTVEVSYDDATTWHPVGLRHSGGDWRGRLDAPSRARFATLRTTARDSRGNSVSQTVVRAFGLK